MTTKATNDAKLPPCPQMDWEQVALLDGAAPCFFIEGPEFCGRAMSYAGHGNTAFHDYVSLEQFVASREAPSSTGQALLLCAERWAKDVSEHKFELSEVERDLLNAINATTSPQVEEDGKVFVNWKPGINQKEFIEWIAAAHNLWPRLVARAQETDPLISRLVDAAVKFVEVAEGYDWLLMDVRDFRSVVNKYRSTKDEPAEDK